MTANAYVLVIHGTWNPPVEGTRLWFQLHDGTAGNFCHELNQKLERLGLGRPVWRSWNKGVPAFGWTGANQHQDRIAGGDELFKLWCELLDADPAARIHVVAHSHGANVALRAAERYLAHLEAEANQIADLAEKFAERHRPREAVKKAVAEHFKQHAQHVRNESTRVLALLEGEPPQPGSGRKLVSGDRVRELLRSGIEHWDRRQRQQQEPKESGPNDRLPNASDKPDHKLSTYLFDAVRRWSNAPPGDDAQFALGKQQIHTARRAFVDAWITSRSRNRLGALCFLGAPFISKSWAKFTWWTPGVVARRIVDAIWALCVGAAASYAGVLVLWAELWLLISAVTWLAGGEPFFTPELDPRQWPLWLQIVGGAYCLLASIGLAMDAFERDVRLDFNPYFSRVPPGPVPADIERNIPFKTLVVHAGLFDEVFLGFSSEPLVYGGLQPQLYGLQGAGKSLLRQIFSLQLWRPPQSILRDDAYSNPLRRAIRTAIHWLTVLPRTFIAAPIIIWFWDRHLTKRLVRLISAYAYGVPAQEFSGAMIVASNGIGQPDYFDETPLDVTRELAQSVLMNPEPIEHRVARYNFLWDAAELEQRKKSSKLWSHLAPLTTAISHRYRLYPGVNRDELERRLAQTSVMLEERMRELVGAVELVHSSYYGNQVVVEEVADFIAQAHLSLEPIAAEPQPAEPHALPGATMDLAHARPERLTEESRPA